MEKVKLERYREHQKYLTIDGEEVPGGSTICKIGDSPEPLIAWAWKLGTEGKDYRRERDKAADIGTIAHFMVECYLNGQVADLSDYTEDECAKALICYDKFMNFWEENKFTKVATEAQLVHPEHRFGGTIDLVAHDPDGNMILLDVKTSKRINDSYIRQIAGYTLLWDYASEASISKWGIIRIGKKEEGDFEVKFYNEDRIRNAQKTFLAQVQLYWAMKTEKPPRAKKK